MSEDVIEEESLGRNSDALNQPTFQKENNMEYMADKEKGLVKEIEEVVNLGFKEIFFRDEIFTVSKETPRPVDIFSATTP